MALQCICQVLCLNFMEHANSYDSLTSLKFAARFISLKMLLGTHKFRTQVPVSTKSVLNTKKGMCPTVLKSNA